MKRLLATLAAPALLVPVLAPAQGPRYAPAQGLTLTKVFEQALELDLEELTTVMDGREVPPEYMPEIDLLVSRASRVAITDLIESAADGRPIVLERTFDTLSRSVQESFRMTPGISSDSAGRATSPLAGRTVRFRLSADGEDYATEFTTGEGDAAALAPLVEDMDLRAFLPTEELAPGAEWEVDGEVFALLFEPGGDLGWDWEADAGLRSELEISEAEIEGTLRLRLAGTEEEGRLAVIELSGELESFDEESGDLEDIPMVSGTATITSVARYRIEGRMLWNLAAGHLDSLEIEAEVEVYSTQEKDPGQPGPEFESNVFLAGTWSTSISFSDEP